MPLQPNTRLGPYEILAPLGAGGMGEVYRARDTRLGREVAVKVLPQQLSVQSEVRARFEREAKTISGLNHPNICTLFDVGREGDTDYLVMELIAGETLADRLARGPLPLPELLRVGTEIASALDRAHRAGVVHRDLKPGNVMLTKSGAKLMDFGLARPAAAAMTSSLAATITAPPSPPAGAPLTAEGTILGTFQYMAPEQLEGREADSRSDIWALGCVLYEMMTGRHAFEGRSQASLIAAIISGQPAGLSDVPTSSSAISVLGAPAALQRLIRNCLAKDPDDRVQTAHDAKLQLQGIAESLGAPVSGVLTAEQVAGARTRPASRGPAAWLPWAVAALGLGVGLGGAAWQLTKRDAGPPDFRFRVPRVGGTSDTFWPRISPDGRNLVVVAPDSAGIIRAYLRPLDQIDVLPIAGSQGVGRPYWSPDGREIAFVVDGKILRVAVTGGTPVVVCAAPGGADLSWGSKGHILMDGSLTDSLKVVPAGGGELQPATSIDRGAGEVGNGWPHFLPDGEHFLFTGSLAGGGSGGNIRLGKLGSLDSKLLGRSDGRAEYAPGGWVLFLRGTTLLAQKLDLGAAKLTGQPITLVENLRIGSAAGHFSVSQNGVLAYAVNEGSVSAPIRIADRTGAMRGEPLVAGALSNPIPSPDGNRLLYQRSNSSSGGTGEIHVVDLRRGTDTRLTFTDGNAATPAWSADGRRFAYVTRSGLATRVHVGASDGLGRQDSIPIPPMREAGISQWAAAGSRLLLVTNRFKAFGVGTEGATTAVEALHDSADFMGQPQVSPDGRWLAYTRGALPNLHIYVESLTGTPGRWQISVVPGAFALWTRGGRELLYEGADRRLYAVEIDTRESFHPGSPVPLFTLPAASFGPQARSWGCDAAGETFYLVVPTSSAAGATIEVASGFEKMVSRK